MPLYRNCLSIFSYFFENTVIKRNNTTTNITIPSESGECFAPSPATGFEGLSGGIKSKSRGPKVVCENGPMFWINHFCGFNRFQIFLNLFLL